VVVDPAADIAPVALAEEPKRRRVRRKVPGSATTDSGTEPTSGVEADEIEPAVMDVTPVEAAAEIAVAPAPEVAAVVEPTPAPQPEIDVAALIADDPNQIVAPPEKPKRGWWRR
jgi:ribonuclease E